MPAGSTGKRYAQAAAQIAQQAGSWARWRQDLAAIAEVLQDEALLAVLQAPRVGLTQKLELVETVFGNTLTAEGMNLVQLLIRRRRIGLFADVQHWFLELADMAEGIERYTITTAQPLTDDLRGAVRQRLQRDGRQAVLTEHVNPDIIGGLMIRHNDLIQDFSVRGQLEVLREQLAGGS